MSNRRSYLRRLGIGAGVASIGVGGAWYGGLIGGSEPKETGEPEPTEAEDSNDSEEAEEGQIVDPPEHEWQMFQYDSANTGYLPDADGFGADCEELWRYEMEGMSYSAPVVAEGTVFVGCQDGILYAIRASDGEEQWRFEAGISISSAPAVKDGIVGSGESPEGV